MKAQLVENGTEENVVFSADIVELSILVSGHQIAEVERVARTHGMTVAQWIRRLIQGCLPEKTAS